MPLLALWLTVQRCDSCLLDVYVNNTRGMLVDLRRKPYMSIQKVIKGQTIEQVQCYKYLGTVIDN